MARPHPVDIAPPDLSCWAASPTGEPYVHERASGVPGPEVLLTALVHGMLMLQPPEAGTGAADAPGGA